MNQLIMHQKKEVDWSRRGKKDVDKELPTHDFISMGENSRILLKDIINVPKLISTSIIEKLVSNDN